MFYSIIITQDETASCKLLQVFSFPSRLKEDKISFHVIMEALSSAEVQSESVQACIRYLHLGGSSLGPVR